MFTNRILPFIFENFIKLTPNQLFIFSNMKCLNSTFVLKVNIVRHVLICNCDEYFCAAFEVNSQDSNFIPQDYHFNCCDFFGRVKTVSLFFCARVFSSCKAILSISKFKVKIHFINPDHFFEG